MVVEVEVFTWTPRGMRRNADAIDGYVRVRDAEQLLEEAYARGRRAGLAEAVEQVKTVTRTQL